MPSKTRTKKATVKKAASPPEPATLTLKGYMTADGQVAIAGGRIRNYQKKMVDWEPYILEETIDDDYDAECIPFTVTIPRPVPVRHDLNLGDGVVVQVDVPSINKASADEIATLKKQLKDAQAAINTLRRL